MNRLVEFFGDQLALEIEDELRNKILYPGVEDRLMFTWARNGLF